MAGPLLHDSLQHPSTGAAASDETATITPGGVNRFLRVTIIQSDGSPPGVDLVKFGSTGGTGGTALTEIHDTGAVESFLRTIIYGLVAPATSAGTIYVEFPASCSEYVIEVEAWEDTDQTTPYEAAVEDNGNGFTPQPTLNVPSTTTDQTVVSSVGRFSGSPQTDDETGQTTIETGDVDDFFQYTMSQRPGQSGSTDMSYNDAGFGTVSNWQWTAVAQALNGSGGAGAPVVTDLNTDERLASDENGNDITGTGFNTAQVFIDQGAVSVEQSINSQSATAIDFDIEFDTDTEHLKHGPATLRVVNIDTQEDSLAIDIDPPAGHLYVDLGTPDATAANRITAVSDIASGDQLQIRGVGGGAAPAGLHVEDDATFWFEEGETPAGFDVRVWDASDATWGAWATQSITQTVAIGFASETDTAMGFTHSKRKAVGLTTETDTALAAARAKAKAIGLATEIDSALSMAFSKAKTIGLATEVDEALPVVSAGQTVAIGLVTETDSALSMTWVKAKAIGLATEVDSALGFTWRKAKAIGLAVETDVALAATAIRKYLIGLASETNAAFGFTWSKLKAIGIATEIDSALAMEGGAEEGESGTIFGSLSNLFGVQANLFAAQSGAWTGQLF